jgi:hypothetical protein
MAAGYSMLLGWLLYHHGRKSLETVLKASQPLRRLSYIHVLHGMRLSLVKNEGTARRDTGDRATQEQLPASF